MITVDQIADHIERLIAEERLAGDRLALKDIHKSAGFLVRTAEALGDREVARRFQILAAQAANAAEALDKRS
ncbi:MAG: hypothetical protein Fur005_32850 [Roseiflexaceae bacterium]